MDSGVIEKMVIQPTEAMYKSQHPIRVTNDSEPNPKSMAQPSVNSMLSPSRIHRRVCAQKVEESIRHLTKLLGFTACVVFALQALLYGSNLWDNAIKSTVLVDVEGDTATSGSGFLLGPNGYVVTAAHVVEPMMRGYSASVMVPGIEERFECRLMAFQPDVDLAVLLVDHRPANFLTLANESVSILQKVIVAGYPFGRIVNSDLNPSLNTSHISAIRNLDGNRVLQLDNQLNPGNSGGPVIDESGRVVGVAIATIPRSGINFAAGRDAMERLLDAPAIMRVSHPEFTSASREEATKVSADIYYLRKPSTTHTVEMDVKSDRGPPLTTQLRQTNEGQYEGNIPPLSRLDHVTFRIELKSGFVFWAQMLNDPISFDTENIRPSEIKTISFLGNDAEITNWSGSKFHGRSSKVWETMKAHLRSTQLETDPNFVECDDLPYGNLVSLSEPRKLPNARNFIITLRVNENGQQIAAFDYRTNVIYKPVPQLAEAWFGPRLSPAIESHFWGSSYRPEFIEEPESLPVALNQVIPEEKPLDAAQIPNAVTIRKLPVDKPSGPQARAYKVLPTAPGACQPMAFLLGERLLFPVESTGASGVYDLIDNRFVAYINVDSPDHIYAPLGGHLFLLIDGNQLIRINAHSLEVTGVLNVDLPFEPIAMWGGLGQSSILAMVGARNERSLSPVYLFDVRTGEGSVLLHNGDLSEYRLMSMENDNVMLSRHGTPENNAFVRRDGEYAYQYKVFPGVFRFFPMDWSGDEILRDGFTLNEASSSTAFKLSDYRYDPFLAAQPLLWRTLERESIQFYKPDKSKSEGVAPLTVIQSDDRVVGCFFKEPWLFIVFEEWRDMTYYTMSINLKAADTAPLIR